MSCHRRSIRPGIELADVFSRYAENYVHQHGASVVQKKAIKAITQCRTSALGGHVSQCDTCGHEAVSYNSCRYRHCPKCQTVKQLRWLEKKKAELLPVEYFHVVFTIPHELNALAAYNAAIIYNLLFQAAWATINTLGHDKRRLKGQMGMVAMPHTWGQTITEHIHLHCIVPGGALGLNEKQEKIWRSSPSGYLFPVKVMSKLFGRFFCEGLKRHYQQQDFMFKNAIADYASSVVFEQFIASLKLKSWNVYAKEPFHGAKGGLEYLARYVSKTAIGNERLVSCDDNKVTFKWRDYADNNQSKKMTLDAHEFIRRYLTHVLPDGFMRVRSFGFLANAVKVKAIAQIHALLNPSPVETEVIESITGMIERLTGIDVTLCSHCNAGKMIILNSLLGTCSRYWNSS